MKFSTFFSAVLFIFLSVLLINKIYTSKYLNSSMSDNQLKLIPINPDIVPSDANQEQAKKFLNTLFKKTKIEFETSRDLEFIDPGSNFESVSCNYCGKEIEMRVWQDAMNKSNKKHFTDLSFITPCCHKKTSLNDLKYNWPAGFAKFEIVISNPPDDIPKNDLAELEKILNTKIKEIWAHY